jgi:RNA polymerase sigma-70 factor (ECF subfamily)
LILLSLNLPLGIATYVAAQCLTHKKGMTGACGLNTLVGMKDASDGELMAMIAQGNQRAFQEVYRRYSPHVLGYSRRLIRDRGLSEETSQEVWIKVVRAASSYRGEGSLKAWLYTVVRRTAFNYLRDHISSEETAMAEVVEQSQSDFEERVLARAQIDEVRAVLETLPVNQRVALTMWLTEDLSYEDIAREMNLSESAVKSLLFRARNEMSVKIRGAG